MQKKRRSLKKVDFSTGSAYTEYADPVLTDVDFGLLAPEVPAPGGRFFIIRNSLKNYFSTESGKKFTKGRRILPRTKDCAVTLIRYDLAMEYNAAAPLI